MVISNGEKMKKLMLHPPVQPLLEMEDPLWINSDLEESLPILTIDQSREFEDISKDTIINITCKIIIWLIMF
jgi:hypothetical protein